MHLLNVKTRKLEYFTDKVPPYAILSHRWTDNEFTFADIAEGGLLSLFKRWNAKLNGFRAQAKRDKLAHIWIDTCCIDKRSSAELGEAINSMYRWYQNADRCYAYLSDVRLPVNGEGPATEGFQEQFRRSAWFSRGWTLQELIAPSTLVFFDADWRLIGLRTDLTRSIQLATGIPKNVLLGRVHPTQTSVAQRMSWAARRVTKREEDMAYCLLGLFDVSMPMIYGEGSEKAFFRLQTQIMLQTPDHSILAWGLQLNAADSPRGGLLATSPSWFAGSEHVIAGGHPGPNSHLEMVGDITLKMTVPIVTAADGTRYGLLNCQLEEDQGPLVAIPLESTEAEDMLIRSPGARVRTIDTCSDLDIWDGFDGTPRPVRVRIDYGNPKTSSLDLSNCIDVDDLPPKLELIEVHPKDSWARCLRMITPSRRTGVFLLRIRPAWPSQEDFVVVLRLQTRTGYDCECEAHIMTLSKPGGSSTVDSLETLAEKLWLFEPAGYRKPTAIIGDGGVRVSVGIGNIAAPGNPGFRLELKYQGGRLETVDASAVIARIGGSNETDSMHVLLESQDAEQITEILRYMYATKLEILSLTKPTGSNDGIRGWAAYCARKCELETMSKAILWEVQSRFKDLTGMDWDDEDIKWALDETWEGTPQAGCGVRSRVPAGWTHDEILELRAVGGLLFSRPGF